MLCNQPRLPEVVETDRVRRAMQARHTVTDEPEDARRN